MLLPENNSLLIVFLQRNRERAFLSLPRGGNMALNSSGQNGFGLVGILRMMSKVVRRPLFLNIKKM